MGIFTPLDAESSGLQAGDERSVSFRQNKNPVLKDGALMGLTETHPTATPLEEYERFSPGIVKKLRKCKTAVSGLKILHINSTANGGGVAELLRSQVPLERELGIDSHWLVMAAEPEFFRITKKIHNLLQGARHLSLSETEKRLYQDTGRAVGVALNEILLRVSADIVVIHDLQPLWAAEIVTGVAALLRIHIDLSTPDAETLRFLEDMIRKYRGVVVSHESFIPAWIRDEGRCRIIMPAIDPFSEKNRPADDAAARAASLGIDPSRPTVLQVSRFDPWKDPIGVVEAYFLARKAIPDLQLVLAGSHASDDPDAEAFYHEVRRFVGDDPSVIFYTESNDSMVNAIRTVSQVVLQKSIREGFGLTVAEAMWKEKAVVGGDAAGIRAQITDGENGFVVSSSADAARRVARLIRDPALREAMGKNARRTILERFLMPRYIEEHLALYADMASS